MSKMNLIFFIIVTTNLIFESESGCSGRHTCDWFPWESWSPCSSSCGGGYHHRSRALCCESSDNFDDCARKCGLDPDDSYESENCNEICYHGTYRGYYCDCITGFYDSCCKSRCPNIANCKQVKCSYALDNICLRCQDNNLFKLDAGNKKCTRKCSHDNRWCWPGECPQEYTRSCTCAPGFQKHDSSSSTVCQPTKRPNITTCNIQAVSANNEVLPRHPSRSYKCLDQKDFYGNIQITEMDTTTLDAEFVIDVPKTYYLPQFVRLYKFGVTDVKIQMMKYSVSGSGKSFKSVFLKNDNNGENAEESFSVRNRSIIYNGQDLLDGERLCLRYEVKGGGYLESFNPVNRISRNVAYDKTSSTRERCYRYDSTPPEHSSHISEPLEPSERLLNTRQLNITFPDWIDKPPDQHQPALASGIETYELSIHEVTANTFDTLARAQKSLIPKTVFNISETYTFTVPENTNIPALFCVLLEVKDVAKNVRQSRRFFLFDNSSEITIHRDKVFLVTTASNNTGYRWQTNLGTLCYSWVGRFVNDKYVTFNPLRPVMNETYGLVSGKYEQKTGLLPVNGTTNVDGIIKFTYSVHKNNASVIPSTDVPNFTSEKLCINIPLLDGDTVVFNLEASDIMSNTKQDSATVYIDRTVPEIRNMWLVRDNYKQLYVHNTDNFREMKLQFEAMDPHSGLKTILWTFGITNGGSELLTGSLHIQRLSTNKSCPDTSYCHCPSVGNCEYYNFTLSMDKLEVPADQNRRYFYKLVVTNNAMLTSIEYIDVLVDVSPPETGVVMEGPVGSPDVDFTAADTVMVHWQGFIDHESGIKLYKLGISDRCLWASDLKNESFSFLQTTDTSMRIPLQYVGTKYVTVIALNNAMEPSVPACSDGITRDVTPPVITDVSLHSASIQDRLACSGGNTWLITSYLSRVLLNVDSVDCFNRCQNSTPNEFVEILPVERTKSKDDISISSFICQRIETYNDTLVYLPTDGIIMKWNIDDEYSQIQDVKVGIGSSRKRNGLPDITGYTQSHHVDSYSKHHLGLSNETEFFIFIKARNTAGLETIASYGPVLIDDTPSICNDDLHVSIKETKIILTWNESTCYDLDQREETGSIFFGVDPCTLTSLCMNGATCSHPSSGEYKCACTTGYSGNDCENEIPCLLSNPCENGGTCHSSGLTYTCSCKSGFGGTNCTDSAFPSEDLNPHLKNGPLVGIIGGAFFLLLLLLGIACLYRRFRNNKHYRKDHLANKLPIPKGVTAAHSVFLSKQVASVGPIPTSKVANGNQPQKWAQRIDPKIPGCQSIYPQQGVGPAKIMAAKNIIN